MTDDDKVHLKCQRRLTATIYRRNRCSPLLAIVKFHSKVIKQRVIEAQLYRCAPAISMPLAPRTSTLCPVEPLNVDIGSRYRHLHGQAPVSNDIVNLAPPRYDDI